MGGRQLLRRLLGVVAVALACAACGSSKPAPYAGSHPPPGIRAPDFALASYRGGVVRMRSLRGKVVVLTFVDSRCRAQCPIIVGRIASALRGLRKAQVTALAVTVDPEVDTPKSIRRFLAEQGALGLVDYLVGSRRRLGPIWKAYGILPATGDADVHSADVRVFDRHGVWVSTLHVGVDLTPANLVHDVRLAAPRTGDLL